MTVFTVRALSLSLSVAIGSKVTKFRFEWVICMIGAQTKTYSTIRKTPMLSIGHINMRVKLVNDVAVPRRSVVGCSVFFLQFFVVAVAELTFDFMVWNPLSLSLALLHAIRFERSANQFHFISNLNEDRLLDDSGSERQQTTSHIGNNGGGNDGNDDGSSQCSAVDVCVPLLNRLTALFELRVCHLTQFKWWQQQQQQNASNASAANAIGFPLPKSVSCQQNEEHNKQISVDQNVSRKNWNELINAAENVLIFNTSQFIYAISTY